MTKKSKSRSKVTTSGCTVIESKEENGAPKLSESNNSTSAANSKTALKNGKISSTAAPGLIESKSVGHSSSLASVPGIVDDFLGPKFVKVLSVSDRGFEKIPPPDLSEIKAKTKANATATDNNANKVEDSSIANKIRKKSKSKKKDTSVTTTNGSEDHRGLEPDGLSLNENENKSPDTIKSHLRSELSRQDAERLAKQDRIRKSAFQYDGNNIVVVPQLVPGPPLCDETESQFQSTSYPNAASSCYDEYNYVYDDDIAACGGARSSAPSDETSILGLDLENEDDEEERVGSWSLSHHVDYSYPPKQKPSSSVGSSESENNASSSTTASGNTTKSYPVLASCCGVLDGQIQICEIKDCTKTAGKKCSQCKKAFYCSEDHQRLDWKIHKNNCFPYRMEAARGDDISYAVASRDIPAGQIIFSEKPLLIFPIAAPENDFINVMDLKCIKKKISGEQSICTAVRPACFGCLKSVEFIGPPRFACSKCSLPLCHYNCQMGVGHMVGECRGLETQGGWSDEGDCCYHNMYMDVEILRALQLENYDYSQWEKFLQMKQNMRVEAYKESKRFQRFIKNYRKLVPISAKMTGYNDDLIGNVHAIITALSFRPSLGSTYKLLFASQILFSHSCIPNTFHYLEEINSGSTKTFKLVTKAAMPICKKELISIDFCPTPFVSYPLRRMFLRNLLSIDHCICTRCKDPRSVSDHTFDIKCPNCHDGLICSEEAEKWEDSVWACNACLEEFPFSTVMNTFVECRQELEAIKLLPKNQIVSALADFISRREKTLNEGHSLIIQAWCFIDANLSPCLRATRLPGPAPRYPEAVVEEYRLLAKGSYVLERHMNVVRPGVCLERGCILLSRHYADMAVSTRRFAIRVITRKEFIQDICKCIKSLNEALQIFQMHEGYTRDVSLHIQDVTSALVQSRSYIEELLMTERDEIRNKRVVSSTSTFKETV
ncbi:unnamed protein product [Orchesella dallaii]|uniref:MYND-type domain-containing protein n=1 Tax=Orchesella dallaii TaxID=48710 RepID=A0ABP1QJ83_9HEXA